MPVLTVPCLKDNYAFVLYADEAGEALVVDPGESTPVCAALESRGLRVSTILLTHHHHDHVGGLPELLARYGQLAVYAHALEGARISVGSISVEDGQHLALGFGEIEVMHVPGHTLGSVAYLWQNAVFTGDTLFGAGCGRMFEGDAAQMYQSLMRLATLPNECRVYSGHEYTEQNLVFAAQVEPENSDIRRRLAYVRAERAEGRLTVPSSMAEELRTNPFLRCGLPEIAQRTAQTVGITPEMLFALLRRNKDDFRA